MNKLLSLERKKPRDHQGLMRESVSCPDETETELTELSPLLHSKVNSKLRVRSNYPIPSYDIGALS